jgi:hypothetical protein
MGFFSHNESRVLLRHFDPQREYTFDDDTVMVRSFRQAVYVTFRAKYNLDRHIESALA